MHLPDLPSGSWPVMLTAFRADGRVDDDGGRSLIDFYLGHGSAGLFATCLSSEIEHLTPDEIEHLARLCVEHVDGRVPVVAGAVTDGGPAAVADLVRRVARTGVGAVVIAAGTIAPPEADAAAWRAAFGRLADDVPDVPLGIYECPWPDHRVLDAETIAWLAGTGRVAFHKDTACDAIAVRAKARAAAGTPLRFFNAHLPTLDVSLRAGGCGYSGVACNFAPELTARACADPSDARARTLLERLDTLIPPGYPANAKAFLAERGVAIGPTCRAAVAAEAHNLKDLEEFLEDLEHPSTTPAVRAAG